LTTLWFLYLVTFGFSQEEKAEEKAEEEAEDEAEEMVASVG
jgi:hypothetical protein